VFSTLILIHKMKRSNRKQPSSWTPVGSQRGSSREKEVPSGGMKGTSNGNLENALD
jgi:hypothetical protein